MSSLKGLCEWPLSELPPLRKRDISVPHAPVRTHTLSDAEQRLALENALRYFPPTMHQTLAPEFAEELRQYGHIYMYRFRPDIDMRAYPIDDYPCETRQAGAIMHMIMNNLDPRVAQFPHELVTYGGNGQVFSNWAQVRHFVCFWSCMHFLSDTIVMHTVTCLINTCMKMPVVVNNDLSFFYVFSKVIPNYSSREDYDRMFALGVTMYGQMTAGSYCYIGPQGIVHGTTITVMNAGRRYLGSGDLHGKVLVTSGLGGMSGAQSKAAVISGCIGVIAEVSKEALEKRYKQGWLVETTDNLDCLISKIRQARQKKEATSIGYHGNIVDVCLKRQVIAINKLSKHGMYFWDYGNAFLLEAGRAGAEVKKEGEPEKFRYPSYVQDIMGDIFSLGFGPFRWVCTSADPNDLETTDKLATAVLEDVIKEGVTEKTKQQYQDNIVWIKEAGRHGLVVGSQARILYSDQRGRIAIATAFNKAVHDKKLKGPVVISRDHHDVSGTDSPFRETSNIYDGSAFCADMAVQNVIGDSFRGATWVSLHNGGGVGWGEVINGGFGLVLDGTEEAGERAKRMLAWDVSNGVARRSWCGNRNAEETIISAMDQNKKLKVTMPHHVEDDTLLERALQK
ncbi:urocanate hydratase [Saccoglossus kowalevskii]|uniref:Urocanate hydratase n=1 Tax=Saccoglossus kowalevskii TaxID=10224 RepID=A0ABM0N152_SACKO|nr:PREDICTED: urocanate hydratase [Saccoglossus kowalevskii]